jgi:hypothetical protein
VTLEGAGFGGGLIRDSGSNTPMLYQSLGYSATIQVACRLLYPVLELLLTFSFHLVLIKVGDSSSGEVFWISDSSIAAPAPKVGISAVSCDLKRTATTFLTTIWV